ncbi:MAG TPA: hypothetical protein VFH72_14375 [Candidatus Baltobacteraceae bacterium]|nr:hypothetical protein [Candidatus Baltobacteraceae bacterium]
MLKAISALVLVAQVLFPTARPGVDRSDAYARAAGNRKPIAVKIGRALFATQWPAQVLNVYADGIAGHDVAGLHVSGMHFHHALTRTEFFDEISGLVQRTFAVAPVEEVDVWTSVPLSVGKGVVVAGDLAKPTYRLVFTVTVRRGESAQSLLRRLRQGNGVFWDQDWEREAFNTTAAPKGSNHVSNHI